MQVTSGSIVEVIRNDRNYYDGDLKVYFRALFFHAQNLRHPYHNLRHMLHVMWLCYEAIVFYGVWVTRRQRRNLLVAALFHDFDHSGQFGNDDLNIERSIRGLRKYIAPEDEEARQDIEAIMRATEYPHKVAASALDLSAQILRDADVSQALSIAWIQQVVIGLAAEWGKTPLEVLKAQGGFHKHLTFTTDWAQMKFPQDVIDAKIAEAQALLELLE